jgi:V8-like Glu-specific endopeptidase
MARASGSRSTKKAQPAKKAVAKKAAARRRTTRVAVPGGKDRPVGNQDTEVRARTDEQPPETGSADGGAAGAGVIENVRGFSLPQESAREATELETELNFPDVGEASFPHEAREIVIGTDERRQITATANYPWRASASLLITARDGSRWIGTGWFIGPHTLMTAGHCVFIRSSDEERHGWARSIDVMPGRNGTELPYGRVTSTVLRSVVGWTEDGEQDYDYGAIILPTDLGDTTGWFGFGVYSDSTLLDSVGNIAGYPGDKPSGTMWYDAKRIGSVGPRRVSYEIDTAGGQSGSAVYRIVDGKRRAFAIHAYGGNHGPRVVSPVYNNMANWKA